jgi:hypothetical protein
MTLEWTAEELEQMECDGGCRHRGDQEERKGLGEPSAAEMPVASPRMHVRPGGALLGLLDDPEAHGRG